MTRRRTSALVHPSLRVPTSPYLQFSFRVRRPGAARSAHHELQLALNRRGIAERGACVEVEYVTAGHEARQRHFRDMAEPAATGGPLQLVAAPLIGRREYGL